MNHNDRALAGLAWLAATMPTLVQQDCLKGDEITDVSATGYVAKVQLRDHAAAERIAARLGLPTNRELYIDDQDYAHRTWEGTIGEVAVAITYCAPIAARRECMDEVTV